MELAARRAQSQSQERSRTATLVHLHRARQARSVPGDGELPSNPTHVSNRAALASIAEGARSGAYRSAPGPLGTGHGAGVGASAFDARLLNHDFAVLRVDVPPLHAAPGGSKGAALAAKLRPDVRAAAAEKSAHTARKLQARAEQRAQNVEVAQDRHARAMYDILMRKVCVPG